MNKNTPTPPLDPMLSLTLKALLTIEDATDGRIIEGITVLVKGVMISGIPVSFKEWSRSYVLLDVLEENFNTLEQKAQSALLPAPENFIHLKNAHIYTPGQRPIPSTKEGVFWRVRLDQIDAFTMGTLRAH